MRFFFAFVLALLISGCSSLKIATDYDPNADMTPPKNFAIVHKTLESQDSLTADRIVAALQNELKAKGYVETAKEKADFYILFHTGVTSKQVIDTDYQYVNMYPYSYGYNMIVLPQTSVYSYDEGKLIVDAVVPEKNKIIWRGTAVDNLKNLETPQARTEYINKVLKELMKRFPK